MTSLPQSIALHLGAHKTATTHLQRSLAAATLDGARVYGPPELRGKGRSLPERFGFPLDPEEGQPADVSVGQMLQDMAQGCHRLVFSDETFAGKLQTGWGRIPVPLYHTAPARIERLVTAIKDAGGPDIDLFLGIRDPAEYLTSAYSQILHGGRVVQPEKYIAKNPIRDVDWADYIARLRAVSGIGRLVVWRHENYAALFNQITKRMTGLEGVVPVEERTQPRLSQQAFNEVQIAKALGEKNAVTRAAKRFPVTESNPPMTLFSDEAKSQSAALYVRQWSAIRAHPNVTALSL